MNTPQLTPTIKQAIFEEARALIIDWYGQGLSEQGACLYWTQVCIRTLASYGFEPRLMAGDMLWPIIYPLDDDGFRSTHFGYEWTPDEPFSQEAIARDVLPEVHVWAAMLEWKNGELGWNVIDFSTKYFKKIAIEHHGLTWETADPPDYIFGEPPPGVVYRYNKAATEYVWKFILRKFTNEAPCTTEKANETSTSKCAVTS